MNFHPLLTQIPTLSNIMLIILSLLLFIVAYKISKNKGNQAGKMFMSLLGITVLILGIGGTKILSEAYALRATTTVSLSDTGHVDPRLGLTEYKNDITGQTQVVDEILSNPPSLICEGTSTATTPACSVGMNIEVGGSCTIICTRGGGESEVSL